MCDCVCVCVCVYTEYKVEVQILHTPFVHFVWSPYWVK